MEIIQVLRLLNILSKQIGGKTGDNEIQIFNEEKYLLTEVDLQDALRRNKQVRLVDKINQIYNMYDQEYINHFGHQMTSDLEPDENIIEEHDVPEEVNMDDENCSNHQRSKQEIIEDTSEAGVI